MTDTPTARPASWTLRTHDGLSVLVPPRLSSLTTFVLLEQETWFESEHAFVASLLEPDMRVLDIGANHGLYTLKLASALPQGHVWAFEPTAEPRGRLEGSVRANGFDARVTVLPVGLSDRTRDAVFDTQGDSELNSLHGRGGVGEKVRLETLDDVLARMTPTPEIGFVKLDVEGEEAAVLAGGERFFAAQSPLVMFEVKHAAQWNLTLIGEFERRGYALFRHLPELAMLVPFDATLPGQDRLLNLFACKPDRQQWLVERGLLAADAAPASVEPTDHDVAMALDWLPALPFAEGMAVPAGDAGLADRYRRALALAAAAQRAGTPAEYRWACARAARTLMAVPAAAEAGADAGLRRAATMLSAHLDAALGQTTPALVTVAALLRSWPAQTPELPLCMPMLRASLAQAREGDASAWMLQQLAEFLHLQSSFSTYFLPADPAVLRQLLQSPSHSAEIERRYVLGQVRANQPVDRSLLRWLPDPRHTANPAVWQAVLAA